MVLEGLLIGACVWGNSDSCNSGGNAYIKTYHLDDRVNEAGERIKKLYPEVYYPAFVVGTIAVKKYTFLIYGNFWFQSDLTNEQDQQYKVVFKYSY